MIDREKFLIICISLVVRYGVSLWPHSGQGMSPMFGDYEAQRHWQEITTNLPVKGWYENSTDNDLLYWGLDYPPLTAYHSWVVGVAAAAVNTSWVELHQSRGTETADHKLMMRISVILADFVILFPAVFLFANKNYLTIVTIMAYPGLTIIDHGHFQYNNISLGLGLAAVYLVTSGSHCLGSVMFVAALNYKQMELYHALPFFFYLLGVCCQQKTVTQKLLKLVMIGVTVLVTFAVIWSPWLLSGPESVIQVVRRIFPFNRGLFEDKVASFWCVADIVLKLKHRMEIPDLAKLCLASTFVLSLPTNFHLLFRPSMRNFILSLVNTSLVFFLFSFHVHEKTILLAALPICLLTYTETEPIITRTIVPWILTVTTFSMLPLLIKDGLLLPTLALSLLYLTVSHSLPALCHMTLDTRHTPVTSPAPITPDTWSLTIIKTLGHVSLLGCGVITVMSQVVPPPVKYPYLWPLIICAYSAGHFLVALVYLHYLQFSGGEIMGKKLKQKTN